MAKLLTLDCQLHSIVNVERHLQLYSLNFEPKSLHHLNLSRAICQQAYLSHSTRLENCSGPTVFSIILLKAQGTVGIHHEF